MPVVDILFHTSTDYVGIFDEQVGIFASHFRSYFIRHMNELTEIGIVVGMSRDMPERIGKLLPRPAIDLLHGREL